MLRRIVVIALTACLVAPLAAQTTQGWKVRIDRSQNAQDPDDRPDLKFMPMGKGFHVVGGPAGTFWDPANTVMGNYTVRATFNLLKPSNHTNYYGIAFGGTDLAGVGQSYTYFMVAQDGTYQIRQRTGENTTTIARNSHASIKRPEANGQSVNTLEVRVAPDTVSYVVNGTVVESMPKSKVKTDGIAGVRVNHMLEVHIDGFQIQKG